MYAGHEGWLSWLRLFLATSVKLASAPCWLRCLDAYAVRAYWQAIFSILRFLDGYVRFAWLIYLVAYNRYDGWLFMLPMLTGWLYWLIVAGGLSYDG
jgi:hypothetical protein